MLYLDIAVVVGELVGLVLASFENGWGQFVFYTQLSNMDDDFFTANGYTTVMARKDFRRFTKKFGVEDMTDLYFGDGDDDDE